MYIYSFPTRRSSDCKYHKLNKNPVTNYYLTVGPLKSGLRCYFVVTTVDKNGRESKYSSEVSAVPR